MSETEQEVFNFATIGEVFEDGVSLIFDGQEEATEKHYKTNTSIVFRAGDRVKILSDSGTYVVEYIVGDPKKPDPVPDPVYGIPSGGKAGESLLKTNNNNYAVEWGSPKGLLPSGGLLGQVLKKISASDYDASWETFAGIPSGGYAGQYLKKKSVTSQDVEWADIDGALPSGGTSGQVLVKNSSTDYDAKWSSQTGSLPTGGTSGQVLLKNSSTNYDAKWGAITGTLPTGGSKGQCLVKSSTTNYAAIWANPDMANGIANQYNTSASYVIQFKTDTSGNFYIRTGLYGTWKKITVG